MKRFYIFMGFWVTLLTANAQNVADFENVQLDSSSWCNGSDGSGGYESGGFWFPNSYNTDWGSWTGFSISNMKDSTTAGYANQYSAITAIGVDESENYAIVFLNGEQELTFDSPAELNGFYVTNATYTYLSMKNGDDYAKKFGGADGTDADYLKLKVSGYNSEGDKIDSTDFFLADFRFEDSGEDYIIKDWQWIDLSEFSPVASIKFKLQSTDVGDWGMNTPSYFCMDNFTGSIAVSASRITNNDLRVYPNPIKDILHVESASYISEVSLIDNFGKIIFQQQISHEKKISISQLDRFTEGIYYLILITDKGVLSRKILKI